MHASMTSEQPATNGLPQQGLAHVRGCTEPPLLDLTLPQLLQQTAERFGASEAAVFVHHARRFTYSELLHEADALAGGLHALGLRKGDRVGIWAPNRPEWLLAQFATARLGLILVTINPAYRLAELEFALNKVGCRALILAERFKSSDYIGMIRALAPELDATGNGRLQSARLPALEFVIRMGSQRTQGMLGFDAVLESGRAIARATLDAISASLTADEPINIQFTSGTTGLPKGATLTHRNIVNNGHFVTAAIRLQHTDRLLVPVPFYHCFGMVMGTLGCITKGACIVIPGEGFEAGAVLSAIQQERCTGLYGVPTMFVGLLEHSRFRDFDLRSLRTGIMAGAPCPIELMKRVMTECHMREVTIAYGMTETSPVSCQSSVDDPIERRVSTVGRVQPHIEVKVVDAADRTVAIGESGELCTRGYSVMRGYWDDGTRTRECLDEQGWMHTGDLATIDTAGYCNIVGRIKDMVIRGGENIYPREIEEYLYRHPKIAQVQVFGVPDRQFGEELCAFVVLAENQNATAEEIREFCRGQIAHYKIPRYIEFRRELPLTVTGKPQKFLMRAEMNRQLGLVEE